MEFFVYCTFGPVSSFRHFFITLLATCKFNRETKKRKYEEIKTRSKCYKSQEKQISLGMRHDGPLADNNCDPASFLMSPTLGSGKITWSSCSRHYLNLFLHTPQSHCLMDHTTSQNELNHNGDNTLPGERFNANQQCMLKYGRGSVHSSSQSVSEICRDLHCNRDTFTWTSHPALEGTSCGENKWCRSGRCVDKRLSPIQALQPVAGGWSAWSQYSDCASSCLRGDKGSLSRGSTGLTISSRLCNNPRPENGGEPCLGNDKQFKTCYPNQCDKIDHMSIEDFANEVCLRAREVDTELIGTGFQRSSSNAADACTVWCHKNGGGIKSKDWTFPDGTTCQTHRHDLPMYCIGGMCQEFKCSRSNNEDDVDDYGFIISQDLCVNSFLFVRDKRREVSIGLWQPVSDCYFNCISPGQGLRLVERRACFNCNITASIQLCLPRPKACDIIKTTVEQASFICSKYRDRVQRLSGFGMQLSASEDDVDRPCKLACQDESMPHRFYLVNGEDGWFPFGTDCSRGDTTRKAYCVSGRCLEFGSDNSPLHETFVGMSKIHIRYRRDSQINYSFKQSINSAEEMRSRSSHLPIDLDNPVYVSENDFYLMNNITIYFN